LLYDAFRLFDHHRNGFITAPELYGALEWLGIEVTPEDILDRESIKAKGKRFFSIRFFCLKSFFYYL